MATPEEQAAAAKAAEEAAAAKAAADAAAAAENNEDAKFLEGLELPAAQIEILKSNKELFSAFKHQIESKRDANAEAKKHRLAAEKLAKEKADAEAAALADQGKFKDLYELEKKKNEESAKQFRDLRIQSELQRVAAEKGIKKVEYVKLFDASKLELDETGNVKGLEAFDQFAKDNADLFGERKPPITPDPTKPGITNPAGSPLEELKKLEDAAKTTRSASALAAYRTKKAELVKQGLIK